MRWNEERVRWSEERLGWSEKITLLPPCVWVHPPDVTKGIASKRTLDFNVHQFEPLLEELYLLRPKVTRSGIKQLPQPTRLPPSSLNGPAGMKRGCKGVQMGGKC